jgi:hypothetical protein
VRVLPTPYAAPADLADDEDMKPSIRRTVLCLTVLAALNAALWLATSGFALDVSSIGGYLFGPKMVRAEVVLKDATGVHDYRVDRGVVTAATATSLTLQERDGTVVTIPVASGARVTLGGAPVPLTALAGRRRKVTALTLRDGDVPAQTVQARLGG